MMRRSTLNFVVDLVTLLAIFAMIATGLVIRFVLPPGTGGRHGEGGVLLWGLGRHDWGDLHFWTSVVLGILLVVHVALHWAWACATVQRMFGGPQAGQVAAGRRNAYGVGFLLAVVLVFGGFTRYAGKAVTRVDTPQQSRGGARHSQDAEPQSRDEGDLQGGHGLVGGSMSLGEVETATGVSVAVLRA